MTAYPKPPRRAPKAPKRIARGPAPRRTSKPRARRATPRAKADRIHDIEFSLFIRHRDPICIICRQRPSTDCAHVISRRFRATRWSVRNAIGACRACHAAYTRDPKGWELLNRIRMGTRAYDALRARAKGRAA